MELINLNEYGDVLNISTSSNIQEDIPVYQNHYEDLVDSKIRAKYSVSEEFAILRQRDEKPAEWQEYYNYCEQCKQEAKAELGL